MRRSSFLMWYQPGNNVPRHTLRACHVWNRPGSNIRRSTYRCTTRPPLQSGTCRPRTESTKFVSYLSYACRQSRGCTKSQHSRPDTAQPRNRRTNGFDSTTKSAPGRTVCTTTRRSCPESIQLRNPGMWWTGSSLQIFLLHKRRRMIGPCSPGIAPSHTPRRTCSHGLTESGLHRTECNWTGLSRPASDQRGKLCSSVGLRCFDSDLCRTVCKMWPPRRHFGIARRGTCYT